MDDGIKEMMEKNIPVQRFGKRVDIADCCLYLVTRGGELLTGSTILADGGSWCTEDNSRMRMDMIKSML